MYAELDNNTYTKTFDDITGIESVYIDIQEYSSALASLLLRQKN